ncbi:MAG: response regulator [Spartobacteria bacterium]|nr:response regulator [Spartobacteria bacterium]
MPCGKKDKETILIADDQPENMQLLLECLEGEGYTVYVAKNGLSAMERAIYAHPDLIILDVMMPVMNGFEACRRLKETAGVRDIPVLFMSALSDSADRVEGFDAGGVDYITKPIFIKEVLARVRTHLQLIRSMRELQNALETKDALLSVMIQTPQMPLTTDIVDLKTLMRDVHYQRSEEEQDAFFETIQGAARRTMLLAREVFRWAESRRDHA